MCTGRAFVAYISAIALQGLMTLRFYLNFVATKQITPRACRSVLVKGLLPVRDTSIQVVSDSTGMSIM